MLLFFTFIFYYLTSSLINYQQKLSITKYSWTYLDTLSKSCAPHKLSPNQCFRTTIFFVVKLILG